MDCTRGRRRSKIQYVVFNCFSLYHCNLTIARRVASCHLSGLRHADREARGAFISLLHASVKYWRMKHCCTIGRHRCHQRDFAAQLADLGALCNGQAACTYLTRASCSTSFSGCFQGSWSLHSTVLDVHKFHKSSSLFLFSWASRSAAIVPEASSSSYNSYRSDIARAACKPVLFMGARRCRWADASVRYICSCLPSAALIGIRGSARWGRGSAWVIGWRCILSQSY